MQTLQQQNHRQTNIIQMLEKQNKAYENVIHLFELDELAHKIMRVFREAIFKRRDNEIFKSLVQLKEAAESGDDRLTPEDTQ